MIEALRVAAERFEDVNVALADQHIWFRGNPNNSLDHLNPSVSCEYHAH